MTGAKRAGSYGIVVCNLLRKVRHEEGEGEVKEGEPLGR